MTHKLKKLSPGGATVLRLAWVPPNRFDQLVILVVFDDPSE